MNRERLDNWCERGILGLVLAILVFGPLATGAVRPPDFLVIQGLTMGAAALWLARLWLNPRPQLLWPPICWAVLAFMAYAVARWLTADIEYVARQEVLRVLVYGLLFFIILNNLHRQESVQLVTFTLIFLGVAISFYAAYQFFTGSRQVWSFTTPYSHRAGGTFINPNHLAGFLEMLLPLTLACLVAGRLKHVTKIMLGYAALVMVFGIAVTISRGGWIASGVSLCVFCGLLFLRRHYRLPTLALVLVVVLGAGFFASKNLYLQQRFQQVFSKDRAGQVENVRFELWQPAIRIWREHFWWGAGPAHFDEMFRPYRPQSIQKQPDRVHNDYLNTLADWGVAGGALVAAALALLCVGVFKTWRFLRGGEREFTGNRSNKFAFLLGASVGLFALLLHSVVEFNMHIPANAILAVTLMALLTSHLRFATEGHWVTARGWVKWAATAVLLAGIFHLGAQEWRHAREWRWLERAKRAPYASPQQIAALKKAIAIEPKNFDTTYALGEAYRVESWEGNSNYRELAQSALDWYARSMKLNPYDPYPWLRYGMTLDWLERPDEAWRYFAQADKLDPNNFFVVANIGWHYVQLGNYAAAKPCFVRSLRLEPRENNMARSYLDIVQRRLAEGAEANRPR